jgi:hypothetical protein
MQWQRRCVSTSVCMLAFRWGQHVCVTSSWPLGQAPGGVHGARPAADIAINSGGRAAGAALAGVAGAAARSGDHGVDVRELVGAGARGGLAGGRASSHGRCNRAMSLDSTTFCKTCAGKQGNLCGEPGVASDSAETPHPGLVRRMELAWLHSRAEASIRAV